MAAFRDSGGVSGLCSGVLAGGLDGKLAAAVYRAGIGAAVTHRCRDRLLFRTFKAGFAAIRAFKPSGQRRRPVEPTITSIGRTRRVNSIRSSLCSSIRKSPPPNQEKGVPQSAQTENRGHQAPLTVQRTGRGPFRLQACRACPEASLPWPEYR